MADLNTHFGEILYVDPKHRSALVLDETTEKVVEVPLLPFCRDDDLIMNTWEEIPKEGLKVRLGYQGDDMVILGPAQTLTQQREIDSLKLQRKLTGINEGDPLYYGIVTDDLSREDGFTNVNGQTFGAMDPLYRKDKGKKFNYSGTSLDDVMPGDKVMTTKDGNSLGILEGGVNIFKASDLCQIIGIRYNDLLRIVSRNFEHFTDFGNITMLNEDGATSFVIEGASSQSESRAGRFNLKINMGQAGDLYKIQILDGEGKEISRFHMKADGTFDTFMEYELKKVFRDSREFISRDKTLNIGNNLKEDIRGDVSRSIHGSEERKITNNRTTNVNNDETHAVGRNITVNIGGTKQQSIVGPIPPANTGTIADQQDIFVGNKQETITTTGNFKRSIVVSGNFEESTILGDFVRATGAGDFKRDTIKGDILDTTILGNAKRNVTTGNIEDIIALGDYKITVTSGNLGIDVGVGKGEITIGIPGLKNSITLDPSAGINIAALGGTGGALNLTPAGQVALGGPAAELLDLIDQTLDEISITQAAAAAHIHGTVVGPTTVPVNAAVFLTSQTKILAIKVLLNLIKGSL